MAEALKQAAVAYEQGAYSDAERFAAGVLRANRRNPAAARILGLALLAQDRGAEAIRLLKPVTKRNDDADLETVLAQAYVAATLLGEAEATLRRMAARGSFPPAAVIELARILAATDRSAEAVETLEGELLRRPSAAVRFALGKLHIERNEPGRAEEHLKAVLAEEPNNDTVLLALAHAKFLQGAFGDAAGLYRTAVNLRPGEGMRRVALARCLLESGARAAGEAILKAVSRGDPRFVPTATAALGGGSRGRFFLRPSRAKQFLADSDG